jgi:hypothetical protein
VRAQVAPERVEGHPTELGDGYDDAGIYGHFPATVDGGDGADRISSGPQGDDAIWGDDGDDAIDAADGLPDRIAYGSGIDDVTADFVDTVAEDCELVKGGPRQPPPVNVPGQPQQVIVSDPAPPSLGGLRARGMRARQLLRRSPATMRHSG